MTPAPADETAYRMLTEQHTLLVLDTETSPAADSGPQRVISLATVPVSDGRVGRTSSRLIDPGEPITNSHIHRLTDADVAGKPGFGRAANWLDTLLGAPDVVLVAHFAAYDVNVLRGEYDRLGRTIPDVPVLDTAALTRYVNHDTGRSASLAALARSLDIAFVPEHDAAKDARATARCLAELLRLAAAAGLVDLGDVLASIGTSTHTTSAPTPRARRDREADPSLTGDHLATHAVLLAAQPTSTDLDTWAAAAIDCAQLRCPLARDRAVAATAHAAALLPRLTDAALLASLDSGQAATHVGAVGELVPHALAAGKAFAWWTKVRPLVRSLPRCRPGSSCVDCREGRPCPLDTLHQAVAVTECGFVDGHIPGRTLGRLLGHPDRGVRLWARQGVDDVAGYACWLAADYLERDGNRSRVSSTVDLAVQLGLERHEPRLALMQAQALTNQGRLTQADQVVQACVRPPGNTDDGYRALRDWRAGPYTELLARAAPPRVRLQTLPRQSRPETRTRPNRLKF